MSSVSTSVTNTPKVSATASGKIARGRVKASAAKKAGGCAITVVSNHSRNTDTLTYELHAKIGGRYIKIDTLASGVKVAGFTGKITFDLDYKEATKALRKMAGQNPNLKVETGTELAVQGVWGSGHRWGLPASKSGGEFTAP